MSDVFTPFHVDTEGWRAAFPGKFVPMCRIGGKCACFRAKTVEISGHLLLSNRCACPDNLPAFASGVASSTDLISSEKGRGQVFTLR